VLQLQDAIAAFDNRQTGQTENLYNRVGPFIKRNTFFMKKMQMVLPIVAIIAAVVTSSFTVQQKDTLTTRIWYNLDPGGDPAAETDYSPDLNNMQQCFDNGAVCGVFANESSANPGHPDLTDAGLIYERKP
jgi:hypothetical protein